MQEEQKKRVGLEAARLVQNEMKLGLGTGSTTAFALAEIGRRVREEGLHVQGVPTSFAAEQLARQHGIPLITLDDAPLLDLALDGADEFDPNLDLIKGRGGAHTREKIVASRAARFVVLVDASKRVPKLGTLQAVPVEVLPMALTPVREKLEALGARVTLRTGSGKDGPVVTDQGFFLLDARFEGIEDAATLDQSLLMIPGVLDHGLFVGRASEVLVAEADGTLVRLTRS